MEQQNQQPIQEAAEMKPPVKTNWKYIGIVAIFAFVAMGGVLLVRGLSQAPIAPTPPVVRQTPPPALSPQSQTLDTSG